MEKITLTLTSPSGELYTKEAPATSIRVGTVKKVLKALDVENLLKASKTPDDFITAIAGGVIASYPIFEEELLKIFPDLMPEELDGNCTLTSVAECIAHLLTFTLTDLAHVGDRLKKKLAENA